MNNSLASFGSGCGQWQCDIKVDKATVGRRHVKCKQVSALLTIITDWRGKTYRLRMMCLQRVIQLYLLVLLQKTLDAGGKFNYILAYIQRFHRQLLNLTLKLNYVLAFLSRM